MIDSESIPRGLPKIDSSARTWRKDVDGLLKLAEELKEKSDARNRRIEIYRVIQVCIVVGLGLVGSLFLPFSEFSDLYTLRVFTLAIGVTVIYVILIEFFIRRIKQRAVPDTVALSDAVALLRETEGVVAEANNWSTLDRAEFKIRLSRFGIGHKNWKTS